MPAMTIRNMMENGTGSVRAWCRCGHEGVVDVSGWNPLVEVPDIGKRLRCSSCGKRPYQIMPAWNQRKVLG